MKRTALILISVVILLIGGCTSSQSDMLDREEAFNIASNRLKDIAESPEAMQYVAIIQDGFNSFYTERSEEDGVWISTWETVAYFVKESGSGKESGVEQELLQRSSWFQINDYDYYEQTRFGSKPMWLIYDDGHIVPGSSSALMIETDIDQLNTVHVLK